MLVVSRAVGRMCEAAFCPDRRHSPRCGSPSWSSALGSRYVLLCLVRSVFRWCVLGWYVVPSQGMLLGGEFSACLFVWPKCRPEVALMLFYALVQYELGVGFGCRGIADFARA